MRIESEEAFLRGLASALVLEYRRARTLHPGFHSAHEGWAVLKEEMDELWDEIRKKNSDPVLMAEEAVQIGAMALKFLVDCCGRKPDLLPDRPATNLRRIR